MAEFHFDLGNSSKGPIGMCAKVKAPTARAATHKLREILEEFEGEIDISRLLSPEAKAKLGDGYINVYVTPNNIRFKKARRDD